MGRSATQPCDGILFLLLEVPHQNSVISCGDQLLVLTGGIEPPTPALLAEGLGIEPSSHALQACAEITRLAHPLIIFYIALFQR